MSRWLTRLAAALSLVLVVGLAAGGPARAAIDKERATTFVEQLTETAIEDIAAAEAPMNERIERFRDLFRDYFDVPIIARLVLGRYWRSANDAEREAFVEVFREVTIYRWAGLFDKYEGQKLKVTGVSAENRSALVHTRVVQPDGGDPVSVDWRLRPGESGDLRVIDITVEGVSMVITQRSEYASVVNNHGGDVGALNAALTEKLEAYRQRGAPPPPGLPTDGN